MSTKTEVEKSPLDTARWAGASLILVAAVAGFYLLADESQLLRVIGLLAAVGVAVAIVWTTMLGQTVRAFLGDSRTEIRKVVWPTKQETTQMTLMVMVMVIIVGIMLWLIDMFLLWGIQTITGQGG